MTTTTVLSRAPLSRRVTAIGIVGFAIALALASQIAVPVPGTPVPITLQPLLVVLAGFWLGPVAGAASMALYLVAGALGAPVFAPFGAPGIARFAGPTGGYLLAYPVSAFVAGWLGARARGIVWRSLAAMVAIALLLVGGLAQLTLLNGSLSRALAIGITPFVLLDIAKAVLAGLLAPKGLERART
jgi:biotin transport system substrate-specific component